MYAVYRGLWILTAIGLFNTVINVILLLTVNKIVKYINEGEGL
ncbi:MAG: hypothetical protein U0Z74_01775 [Romboutsia timonensis]